MAKLNWNRPKDVELKRNLQELQKKQRLANARPELPVEPAKMNFGKYKGFKLSSIPSGYLEWVITICKDDQQAMRYARELARRPDYLRKHNL